MNPIRFYYYKVIMPPRRMTRTTQGIARETSQPRDSSTPHLTSGTPQKEGVVDPNGSASRAHQESDMAQLMQTLIRMVQAQQQIQQQSLNNSRCNEIHNNISIHHPNMESNQYNGIIFQNLKSLLLQLSRGLLNLWRLTTR